MSEIDSGIRFRQSGTTVKIAGDDDPNLCNVRAKINDSIIGVKIVDVDDEDASDARVQINGVVKAFKLRRVYFGVTITPSYIETDSGDHSKTETFTIAVQAYNYGSGDLPEPVEGVSYVNKKAGTESRWWYVAEEEWRKETVNPNLIPPAVWEYAYVGDASVCMMSGGSGYSLYKNELVFDTITFVEAGGGAISESGIYVKASDGDLSDNRLFLIIEVAN